METWTTVAIALIVALSTLSATFIQNRYSNKRFERELQRAREADYRERRREVRGEPLLKLRDELTRMAAKQERAVAAAHSQHTRFGITEEEAKKELQEAADDWNTYLHSGALQQILFLQYDTELINNVKEILLDYSASYDDMLSYKKTKATELGKAREVLERNKARIIEVQALINKLLEES